MSYIKWWSFIFVFLLGVNFYFCPRCVQAYTFETGWIEVGTNLTLLATIFYIFFSKGKFNYLLVVFPFLFLMEEISWGQHFLNFSTPSWLQGINIQEEVNLHNIEFFKWQNTLLRVATCLVLLKWSSWSNFRGVDFALWLTIFINIFPIVFAGFDPGGIDGNWFLFVEDALDEVGELFIALSFLLLLGRRKV